MRPGDARRKKAIAGKSYHKSLDDSMKMIDKKSHTGHISVTAALQECPKIRYPPKDFAERLFKSLRPWHSSPVVPRPKEEGKVARQHAQECPYDPACHMLDDEIHLDRFTHACSKGFFCLDTDRTHRR